MKDDERTSKKVNKLDDIRLTSEEEKSFFFSSVFSLTKRM
tara:strand:+ start:931 stop:1050 length:120 start_codon:yes stop_codon:yes gene_type:complete